MLPVVVIPKFLKRLFPQLIWEVTVPEKIIYLTFDDGPEPEVTPQVLALLYKYRAHATFFCIGEKAEKYPELFAEIRKQGHKVGNHGYRHISGFSTKNTAYSDNFQKGAAITDPDLFRPPYGRITPGQIKTISTKTRIILWSIMSMDFHHKTTTERCIKNVLHHSFPGAIIVFHDTPQASRTLLEALPAILEALQKKGYTFKALC